MSWNTMVSADQLDAEKRQEVAGRIDDIYRRILTDLSIVCPGAMATEDFKADPDQTRNSTSFMIRDVEVPVVFRMEIKGSHGLRVNGKIIILVGTYQRNHVFRDRKEGHNILGLATCIAEWAEAVDASALRQVEVEKHRRERRDCVEILNGRLGADPKGSGPFLAIDKFDRLYIEMPELSDDNLFLVLRYMKKELGL